MAYVRSGSQQPTGNAVAGDVKSGKTFSNENDVDLVGTFAAQEKTVTAGTSAASVTPDSGKYLSKVTYNPTPSQAKSVAPSTSAQTVRPDSGKLLSSVSVSAIQTETKTVTPTTSAQNVTPTSGKFLTKVTVNAISTQEKSVTPTTSSQSVTPDSGKYLSKVTVGAINTQTKTVTASRSNQTVTPDSGKYLSQVTVNKYPDASGTYVPTGSDLNNAAADMGATNNLRFVNTKASYDAGMVYYQEHRAGYIAVEGWARGECYARQDVYDYRRGSEIRFDGMRRDKDKKIILKNAVTGAVYDDSGYTNADVLAFSPSFSDDTITLSIYLYSQTGDIQYANFSIYPKHF